MDVSRGRRRAVVRAGGHVVQRFTVAVGRPGNPTPLGRYAVTDKIRFPHPGAYGCCALALSGHQPSTPQGWGGGDRLAFHGTQHEETVGQAASLGCMRMRRVDIARLVSTVPLGTPVRIGP
jgi:lipoprotein-anchoring transpeptidase ErfK/SrfK